MGPQATNGVTPLPPQQSLAQQREHRTGRENGLAQGREVKLGNGDRRTEMARESSAILFENSALSSARSDDIVLPPSDAQADPEGVEQPCPMEYWAGRMRALEDRISRINDSEKHKKFLMQQMPLFREFVHLMSAHAKGDHLTQWLNSSFLDFDKLISEVKPDRIPGIKMRKPPAEYQPGTSIIHYHFRKFESEYSPSKAGERHDPCEKFPEESSEFSFHFQRSGLSSEHLLQYHQELRSNLSQNKQSRAYAVDRLIIDDLIEHENTINPGINLHHVDDAYDFAGKLKNLLQVHTATEASKTSEISFRFLVGTGWAPMVVDGSSPLKNTKFYTLEKMVHYCAFDIFKSGDELSIIGLEPTRFHTIPASFLRNKILAGLAKELPSAKIHFLELDIQRSDGECHIFCLSFLRKAFSLTEKLKLLHSKNFRNELQLLPAEKLRNLVPVQFMKHVQSSSRITEYLEYSDEPKDAWVNKKSETLQDRYQRHLADLKTTDKTTVPSSNSIDRKRLSFVEGLAQQVISKNKQGKQ